VGISLKKLPSLPSGARSKTVYLPTATPLRPETRLASNAPSGPATAIADSVAPSAGLNIKRVPSGNGRPSLKAMVPLTATAGLALRSAQPTSKTVAIATAYRPR
jgi:hypothetical protein